MPLRRQFACLWCGQDWTVRSDDDLEGWAALCPDCLSKADDNGFLRSRLRTALRERAAATASSPPPASVPTSAPGGSDQPDDDDWYLRRGRFSRGPLHDGPWSMELDEVTRWLDGLPIAGTIVELAAGSGWWTTLLAEKGELWAYDASETALEAARTRLVAHGLLAHLHVRDPLAAPDKQVDVVVATHFLSGAATHAELRARIEVAHGWLKPDGLFVFIEARPGPGVAGDGGAVTDGPRGSMWPRDVEMLRSTLLAAGLDQGLLSETRTAFVMGSAVRPE